MRQAAEMALRNATVAQAKAGRGDYDPQQPVNLDNYLDWSPEDVRADRNDCSERLADAVKREAKTDIECFQAWIAFNNALSDMLYAPCQEAAE